MLGPSGESHTEPFKGKLVFCFVLFCLGKKKKKALAVLTEDPGFNSQPQEAAHNHLQCQGAWFPSLPSVGIRDTSGAHTHTFRQMFIHIKNVFVFFFNVSRKEGGKK